MKPNAVTGFMATNPGRMRLSISFPNVQPSSTIPPPNATSHPSHRENLFNQQVNRALFSIDTIGANHMKQQLLDRFILVKGRFALKPKVLFFQFYDLICMFF
jgi:hypothetical protein